MRLHRLTLRDVKGVTDRTVVFPDHGVVVIEGPNEVGKSTLLEAFDRLLDPRAKAGSRSAAVRALQPVGRDVGPFVEAEFSVGGYRLRFAKRWLREAMTVLEVLEPAPEQHTGSAAQQRLEAILGESLDRTLWDALRFAQAAGLTQLGLQDSDVLNAALDGASGADLHAEDGGELLERVESEYLRYWTPTGRVTGELREAKTQAERARDHAVDAHGRLQEAQRLLDRLEQLRQDRDALTLRRPGLAAEVERAEARASEVADLVRVRDEAVAGLGHARESYQRAREDAERRRRLVQELVDAEQGQTALESQLEQAREREQAAQRTSDEATERADAARAAAEDARAVADRAADDQAHAERVARLEELAEVLETTGRLDREAQEARAAASAEQITAVDLRRAEELTQRLAVLQAQHDSTSPSLVLESLTHQERLVLDGEDVVAEPGRVIERRVLGDLQVELPGRLRVTVRPDAGARDRRVQIDETADLLQSVTGGWGTTDLELARGRVAAARDAAARAARADERRADLLRGRDPVRLAGTVATLESEVSAYLAARDPDLPLPDGLEQARAVCREAQRLARAAEQEATASERACREVDRVLTAAGRRVEGVTVALDTAGQQLRRLRELLEQERRARSDEDLEEAVRARRRDFAGAEARAGVAERSVAEHDVAGIHADLESARRALTEHDTMAAGVHDDLLGVTGQVELVSGEGRQEAYDLAVADTDEAYDRFRAVLRRAHAARTLRETLRRHRDLAHQAYVRPYREEIERLGRTVYGDSFAVTVTPSLEIESRTLLGATVPFAELSGGAKEQLGIIARLAVAALVDPHHGVPVVIDDALGYTDPDRLQRVAQVFAGPARHTQVILLTCTPQRYAAIEDSHIVDLSA